MKTAVLKSGSVRFACAQVPAGLEILPAPQQVSIVLPKGYTPTVVEGQSVIVGQPLCRKPRTGMFASLSGTVKRIRKIDSATETMVTAVDIVAATGTDLTGDGGPDASPVKGSDLFEAGRRCGMYFPAEKMPYCVFFVDGDSPKVANRWCLDKEYEKTAKALQLISGAIGRENLFIVVGTMTAVDKKKGCAECGSVIETPDAYPDTLPGIIVQKHAVLKSASKVVMIDGYRLPALAESMATGRPPLVTRIALQYGRKEKIRLLQVTIGMRIGDLLDKTGIVPRDGDQVVTGGEICGSACYDLSLPVTADTGSVLVIPSAEASFSGNNACVNCGRCVSVCPAGLRVDRIGKCIELSVIDEAATLGVMQCIGCGLCSAVCMTHRPLAHLMVTGKHLVASAVKETGGC